MSTQDPPPDTGASDATARPIPAEVLAATQGARTVIAPTDEGRDDAYRQGRAAAIALCAALKAKLILVDRATESWWIDPYGSGSVTADTDLRLSRYWGLSEGFWLRLQADHDLMEKRREMGAELEKITPRAA